MSNHINDIPEGFKMTELGPLPGEWETVKLNVVAQVKYGRPNPKDGGHVPVIGSGGIFSYTNIPLVDYPTLVVGRKGTAGKVWYCPSPCYPSDTTFYLQWKRDIDVAFLFYFMSANPLSGAHAKTTLPSLQKQYLEGMIIPSPPLPEQKAIAGVLSTIQKAVEAQDKLIAAARELKKSLMHHLFTYGPVPVAEAEHIPLKETEIGPVPEHWEVKKIEEVASFTSKPRELDIANCEDVPFIPMEAISNDGSGKFRYNIKPGREITSGVYCERGDLLIAKITPCLENEKQCLVSPDLPTPFAYATTEVYPIKTNQNTTDIRFLFHYLLYPPVRRDLASKMEGTTGRQRLPKHVVRNRLLPLPPLPEQKTIAQVLSSLNLKIESEENRKAALQALFKTMLHHLVTGKVRVKDMEAQVS